MSPLARRMLEDLPIPRRVTLLAGCRATAKSKRVNYATVAKVLDWRKQDGKEEAFVSFIGKLSCLAPHPMTRVSSNL